MWNSRPSRLTSANVLPSRTLPDVFKYRPERGPLRMSAYAWPSTALVFSSAGALSVVDDEEVLVGDVSSEEDDDEVLSVVEDEDDDFSAPTVMTLRSLPVP